MLDTNEEFIKENTIIKVVAGSHAYGTNLPSSDWDERGIFIDSMDRIILPFEKIEQFTFEKDDVVVYELSKFMPLLLEQNPNILEILWAEDKNILSITEEGEYLASFRETFLTKKIKDSYVGYANSQLTRIKGHNKWINNPQPKQEPQQVDFFSIVWNYSNEREYNKTVPKENYFAINLGDNHFGLFKNSEKEFSNWIDKKGKTNPIDKSKVSMINQKQLKPEIIVKFNESLYKSSHQNWKSYWSWKSNRNEKRAELEIKYGYDTKHAMHLIRLLKTGCEVLEHGQVFVHREDKDFLLSIRNGEHSYDEIIKMSQDLTEKVNILVLKSKLPEEANYKLAKEVMLNIYKSQWNLDFKDQNRIKSKLTF